MGRHFLVHTDHYNLKFLLDQRLSIVPQHQWISKLFGFDFAVEYRPDGLTLWRMLCPAATSRTVLLQGRLCTCCPRRHSPSSTTSAQLQQQPRMLSFSFSASRKVLW